MIKLINGDCLAVLAEVEAESVDAIITDPPYGIDFQSAWRTDKTKRFKKIANDKRPFIWWLFQAERVLKPGGCLMCFCRWDVQEPFKQAIEWAGLTVKAQVIWDRMVHGMGDLKGNYAPQHDVIWFATKGSFQLKGTRPKSIIKSQRLGGHELVHPNEKPVDLMKQIIIPITLEGALVLDPFMGSGATGAACLELGRDFIGIEKDENYYLKACQRLEEGAV